MDFGEITFMFAARDNDLGLLYSGYQKDWGFKDLGI
jgi:hypothetical protein